MHESSAPSQPTAPHRVPRGLQTLATIRRSLPGALVLALGALAWWWLATHHFTGVDHAEPAAADGASSPEANVVRLPDAAARGEITLARVERRPLRAHLTVPGRLDYDARSRLDYESPVDGIVSRVSVAVRQKVAKGDSLAEVSSLEVGMARDEVRKREDEREIARKAADWSTTIAENVQALLDTLARHPPLDRIEREFEGRTLGDYRETIVGSYSRLLYVEKVNEGTKDLGAEGVLSGRIIEERTSNLEVARATFAAACERATFDTRQDRDKAKAALDQAERLLQVSRENLRTLVGSRLESEADAPAAGDDAPPPADALSVIALRTPISGVVEEVFVSRGERMKGGDRMFVVADTARLWVRAQIHEKQWTTLDVAEGQEVRVVVPGSEEHQAAARINHIAGTVDATSRSVPIVAELENDDAHYKPGMFVWVELPQGEPRDAVAVPAAAVMRHEGKAFVFVPADGGFRRVDVATGIENDDFIEVTRGLETGREVVARGAFLLKSELLLEDEG
ncbi:MAG: efflux RND transporter periplasmic adaptor subunit [Planctomycetota bacterium]